MKILVTGGTGFLGKNLALRLKALEYDVTVLGRNRIIGQKLESKELQFLPIDLKDSSAIIEACKGKDYVFHCGGLLSPWGKYQDFYNANVLGTRNIIQGCQTHKVKRLIHVSSSSVYFDFCHRLNISENTPFPSKPANAYAKTKQLAEKEINAAYRLGLPAIAIRPRAIFGPGDTNLLPRMLRASVAVGGLNKHASIPLINEGKAFVDVTYIDNVVDALLLCQNAPDNLLGRTFNITNGEPIYVATFFKMLFNKLEYPFKIRHIPYNLAYWIAAAMELASLTIFLGREPLITRFTVELLAKNQTLDITAAREELGYQPRISVEQGLEIFARWWKEKRQN